MKLLHLTDIHLDFTDIPTRNKFYLDVYNQEADYVLIGGDIADGPKRGEELLLEFQALALHDYTTILFVFGNHDCYNSSIKEVDLFYNSFCKDNKNFIYLPNQITGIYRLPPPHTNIVIIGDGLWYDGLAGDPFSNILLNDFSLIKEMNVPSMLRRYRIREIGEERTNLLKQKLEAINMGITDQVFILTHIPPYREATYFNGKISTSNWLTYMCCYQAGLMLDTFCQKHLNTKFTILCGHTHGKVHHQRFDNLTVMAPESHYRYPSIGHIFNIE